MVWLSGAAVLLGYLLGSLPTAYLITKRVGRQLAGLGQASDLRQATDIRQTGDGNAGAANVGRLLGARWGILVAAVDIAKGAAPVLLCNALAGSWDTASSAGLLGGASAIIGHVWPVWIRFRGGRGAATALGVAAALLTGPMLVAVLPGAAILWRTRSATITLAFVYICAVSLARPLFGAPWGLIGYCVGMFVAIGAVHFWSLKFRPAPADSAPPDSTSSNSVST